MGYNGPQPQMKKTLLLALAMFFATVSFAQQQLATLNHNDSITVYYGASALQQAHNAAVAGDIITLSPGSFTSVTITKPVSIRGAGMFPDSVAGTAATILLNSFDIDIENNPQHNLYMEGIYCSGDKVRYQKLYNPQFVKCYFRLIVGGSQSNMQNATFLNCIVNQFNSYNATGGATAHNTHFVNSVILNMDGYGNPSITNCVALLVNPDNVSINNSIVYSSGVSSGVNAYTAFNSIGLITGNSGNYFNYYGLPNHNLHNYQGYASVFKNFRGTYGDGITFELLDTVATTCLGSDGTQVGIYGGMMPFDPSVRNPLIKKCNVASRSTADGKLAVDIEIVSE